MLNHRDSVEKLGRLFEAVARAARMIGARPTHDGKTRGQQRSLLHLDFDQS